MVIKTSSSGLVPGDLVTSGAGVTSTIVDNTGGFVNITDYVNSPSTIDIPLDMLKKIRHVAERYSAVLDSLSDTENTAFLKILIKEETQKAKEIESYLTTRLILDQDKENSLFAFGSISNVSFILTDDPSTPV